MDAVLEGYIVSGLNGIKRLAILIKDGEISGDEVYEASASIIEEADKIIEEMRK